MCPAAVGEEGAFPEHSVLWTLQLNSTSRNMSEGSYYEKIIGVTNPKVFFRRECPVWSKYIDLVVVHGPMHVADPIQEFCRGEDVGYRLRLQMVIASQKYWAKSPAADYDNEIAAAISATAAPAWSTRKSPRPDRATSRPRLSLATMWNSR